MELVSLAAVAAEEATQKAIAASTQQFLSKIPKALLKKYSEIEFIVSKGLPKYLEANYAKCETLKTLISRNDPVAIKDCFVAPRFKISDNEIATEEFLKFVGTGSKNVIITGLAGSGKSVFLKHSFRSVIERGFSYYPIFFELRTLNQVGPKRDLLITEIFKSIADYSEGFKKPQFELGLRNGSFFFLLDGFDELDQDIRDDVALEIQNISAKFGKCAVLMTSRPSQDFVSWEGFFEARLLPFDIEQTVEYVSKIKFDIEKKDEFTRALRSGLFEKRSDFLSNPLLTAMMLLTYDTYGEIPEKRHVFFAKCFEVLTTEHDASKGRYKRKLYAPISMEELEKVFMYFCAFSYYERTFSFSTKSMISYTDEAINAASISSDTHSVIKDFCESISIIEKDGLYYTFAHRSFQEYFYAKFVVEDRSIPLKEKIDWLIKVFQFDDTVSMIADMKRDYFEDDFLLPHAKELKAKLDRIDPLLNPAGVLKAFYSDVRISNLGDTSDPEDTIAYTISSSHNLFIREQAEKYARERTSSPAEPHRDHIKNLDLLFSILMNQPENRIAIHHSNNPKLIEANEHLYAAEIKRTITLLYNNLVEKQKKRTRSISTLIRHSTSKAGANRTSR